LATVTNTSAINIRPRTAGIYTRISSDPGNSELGVERQREDCERLVRERGWELAGEYRDNDVSAFDGRTRPAYERLLRDIRAGRIDTVISWHSDRLHRSLSELETFIKLVEERGIAVEAVTSGTLDLGTPSGRAMARTMTTMARFEVEHRSERIRRKAAEIAKSGRPTGGGIRAFGLAPGWESVIEPERALIQGAADRIMRGESLGSIVSDWRRRGVRTPGRSTAPEGRYWTVSSLKRMLIAPRIVGDREHRGVVVASGGFPAMLDRPTWERVRDLLSAPRGVAPPTVRRYFLTGLARCGRCGAKLSPDTNAAAGSSSRRYSCRRGAQGCGRLRVLAKHLEGLVGEAILYRLDTPEFRRAIEARSADAGHDGDAGKLRIDEASMAELASDYYVRRAISKAEFFGARKALEARIDAARRALAASTVDTALDQIANLDLRDEWERHADDAAWRNWIARTLIDRVTVNPAPSRGLRFHPNRVDVTWKV
jgi:site-specific DNA recombinase